jgi:HK97 family phage major capsid protein
MTATTVSANIPTTVAELEEALSDPARVGAAIQAGTFKEWITNYARTTLDKDATLAAQVREETQRVLGEYLREQGVADVKRPNLTPATAPLASTSATYNPKAMGAALDSDYQGSADYFKSIWHLADRGNAQIADKLRAMRNAFSSTVPSEGGFLIPETLRSELLRISLETSIVRPRARVIPMESLRVPFPAIDSTSNVSSVYGGIVGYWTEESGTLTASSASFGRIILDAKKLTAYTEVPNELISDSALSFQAFIDQIFPEALGFYEDDAFINGNGVGQPAGFLNCLASVSVSAESGQATATIVWQNIVKMYARMLPSSLNRCVWIAAPDTFPELATMALAVGTGGSAIWLNNGASGPPMTILGRPVIFSEKMPTLGTTGDISLVDLSYYLIGDRQVMSAMSSPHFKFSNDQTAYRVIERVDGQPWLKSAITPRNNSSSTLSPFVQIATR